MANPKLRFRFFEPTIDTNLPLTDGTVRIDGFDLECVQGEADAWDQGFAALMGLVTSGAPIVCIPAFPNRKFRLGYIQVNAAAGIKRPKQLEGKRVGITSWVNTAGVWARGALQNYYHVDLAAVDWRAARIEDVPLPEGVSVQALPAGAGPSDERLNQLLLEGQLDAVISPNVLPGVSRRDPRLSRLFADYKAEEQSYFKATRIFPISHVIAMSRDFVERHPEAPVALLKAYRQARDVAFDRIEGSDPVVLTISWAAALMAEQRVLMGDNYWAYNLADNRRALESMMLFAEQQALTPTRLDYTTLFDPRAAALPGC